VALEASQEEEIEMMNKNRDLMVVVLLAACFLTMIPAFAAKLDGKIKVKGVITGHTGNALAVQATDNEVFHVLLSNATKVRQLKGFVGAQKKQMSAADLIPGLKVTVEGVSDSEGRVIAKSIIFEGNDFQTANIVRAGVTPTDQKQTANQQDIAVNKQNLGTNKETIEVNKQSIEAEQNNIEAQQQVIASNKKRIEETAAAFNKLDGEEVQAEATVHFAAGSSEISPEAQKQLKQLAHDTISQTDYMIQVKGFADSSGSASENNKLSQERAEAVIAYLLQDCDVPVRHIVTPGAMGISNPAASNQTADGRSENRRVEVRVFASSTATK
jgi:outer membrane protein OmpA-like peptidoglycan-associated protein